jgi:hypothetical protein
MEPRAESTSSETAEESMGWEPGMKLADAVLMMSSLVRASGLAVADQHRVV